MATIKAVKNGVWSDTTVWDSGTVPGIGDDAYTNGYDVTLDQDVETDLISAGDGSSFMDEDSSGHFIVNPTVAYTIINITANVVSGVRIFMDTPDTSVTLNITGDVGGGTDVIQAISMEFDDGYSDSHILSERPVSIIINGDVRAQVSDVESYYTIAIYSGNMLGWDVVLTINGNVYYAVSDPDDPDPDPAGYSVIFAQNSSVFINGDILPEISGLPTANLTVFNGILANFILSGEIVTSNRPLIITTSMPFSNMVLGAVYLAASASAANNLGSVFPIVGQFFVEDGIEIEFPIGKFNPLTFTPTWGSPEIVSNSEGGGSGDCPDPQHVRQGIAYGDNIGTLAVPMPEQVAFGIPVDQGVGLAAISLPQLSDITGDQIAAAFEK